MIFLWLKEIFFFLSTVMTMLITVGRIKMRNHAYLGGEKVYLEKKKVMKELWFKATISQFSAVCPSTGLACCYFPVASQLRCSFTVCAFTKSAGRFVVAWLKGVYPDAVNHSGSAALLITGQSQRSQAHTAHTYGLCMLWARLPLTEVGCSEEWVVASVYL